MVSAARSYLPPVEIGQMMRALAVGRVIASRHGGFAEGELVQGTVGVHGFLGMPLRACRQDCTRLR